ncbi:exonuclease 1 isoform X2 [Saccopteryx bilineata]|uniref:exonuclease 1 isoform X2 n=1 Tax=Saccopteryx bilineata TaxID=59482 RepID=UPI00338DAFFD
MGIQGLLQFIKEASEPVHMRKYKGQVVAVDTYCWLHKGAIACAEKLAKGEPTDKYVGFCMKFVNMLLSHGIKPILVFDGCTLPSKKEVEKSRRERRQANLLKGRQLLREGKVSEARDCFTRCVNITHAMAHKVIKVILKMDQFGNGLEIDQARLGMCKQLGDVFTEEKFRYMCILSGCDYLASLRGIGLAKACRVLRIANNPDIEKVIKKIGHYLKMNITVSEDYIKGFIRANNTFLYQLVFDPVKRKLTPLNDYRDDIDPETLSYAGQYIDNSIALQIALGNKDINTFEQIDDYNPDTAVPAHSRSHSWDDKICQKPSNVNSIWHRNYCPRLECNIIPNATRLKENSSTMGIEQVINTKGLNLPRKLTVVKRPRSEELSEDDLINQYSLSFTKKPKRNSCKNNKPLNSSKMLMSDLEDGTTIKKCLSTPSTTRNKFAVFLQRRNEESGAVVVPGTRSRFFCNSLDSVDCVLKKASSQPLDETAVTDKKTNLNESDCLEDTKPVDLSESDYLEDTKPVDLNESDYLEDKKLADLNESSYPKDKKPVDLSESDYLEDKKLVDRIIAHNSSDRIPDDVTVIADEESLSFNKTREFTRTISPPTLGSLRSCFSWSGSLQDFSRTPSPSPRTALHQFRRKSDSPRSVPENKMSDVSQVKSGEPDGEAHPLHEVGCSSQSQESVELSPHSLSTSKLSQPSSKEFNSKASGLYKSSSVDSLSTTKIKPLVPARVSGLSKKPASAQKRRHHHNAENKPGLQIKINELWKNFGFKKDSEKVPSCKKPDPLSPVKDNIQLTPETDEDILNKPECMCVQRAIFQ